MNKKTKFLLKKLILCVVSKVYKVRKNETLLSRKQYLANFEIVLQNGEFKVLNEKKLEYAYQKSWDNRNFEIDKFWTRAAYFWGFIVLIFGGYITILTSDNSKKAFDLRLDLYFLGLGLIFSIAWYLVILGSKSWQENWEHHIDQLENFISGPIYKTVHYSGNRFYSVSKINEVLSIVVIFVWAALFSEYYFLNCELISNAKKLDIPATFTMVVVIITVMTLTQGYCLGYYKAKKKGFIDRWNYI